MANGNRTFGVGVNATECSFTENGNQVIKIANGKVGIGTLTGVAATMPGNYCLFVEKGITTEAVRVKLKENWSDYVFEEDYKLLPLSNLQQFIKENKHLPEVPTSKEVKADGIELAATSALLLKKIEELTLYIIQQDKRIMDLERKANQR